MTDSEQTPEWWPPPYATRWMPPYGDWPGGAVCAEPHLTVPGAICGQPSTKVPCPFHKNGPLSALRRGYVAGTEAAARTMERIAAEWKAPPEQAGAVRLFADMVAKAVREAAVGLMEEQR